MNFFDDIKVPQNGEIFKTLYNDQNMTIERIVSSDKQEGKRYRQDHDEWVMVMQGCAILELQTQEIRLGKGDFLMIPKGVEHQVLKTEKGTIWFCIHVGKNDQ